jgi:hypothetical protein
MSGLPARVIVLDVCERVLIATIYGAFAWRMLAFPALRRRRYPSSS